MANPQSYQPLSHALHPPVAGPSQTTPTYTSYPNRTVRDEDMDEEEDIDEGLVEEHLNRVDPDGQGSSPSSPSTKPNSPSGPKASPQDTEPKRRPGRPKGSKNRRPRAGTGHPSPPKPPAPLPTHIPLSSSASTATAPRHPDVNAQNQQYYEFQWRVLSLCSEFYTAAEELVKGTQPLVIAQCYKSAGNKVDPLAMLGEAKRICDTLLANPTKLTAHPPPPMHPPGPPLHQSSSAAQPSAPPPPPPAAAPPPRPNMLPPTVITQPQSFVVPMGSQYPVYHQVPGTYPTAPYYPYHPPSAQTHPTNYYPPTHQQPGSSQTSPSTASPEETTRPGPLKDPSRGVKRRRGEGDDRDSPAPPTSANSVPQTASPHSQSTSTPIASPSLQNQQRPTSTTSAPPTSASGLSWPMPTVATTTPSPVIATAEQRVTSYYRPRPSEAPPPKPAIGHTYIAYQPNGTTSSSQRLSQNGK